MSTTTSIPNDLIVSLKDGQEGFRTAAEDVQSSDSKSLFSEYSLQRSHFAEGTASPRAQLSAHTEQKNPAGKRRGPTTNKTNKQTTTAIPMKTLLKLAASACLSIALVSISLGADEKMTKKDHIMMKDNKVMCQKDGKVSTLDKEMKLDNGTTVAPDGTVTTKGGEKMTLKNGDAIDMMGMKMKDHVKKDKDAKAGDAGANPGTNKLPNAK